MEGCLRRTEEDDKLDAIIMHEPCVRPSSPRLLRSSVVRASHRCTEGHRFNTCRGQIFSLSHARDTLITSFVLWCNNTSIISKQEAGCSAIVQTDDGKMGKKSGRKCYGTFCLPQERFSLFSCSLENSIILSIFKYLSRISLYFRGFYDLKTRSLKSTGKLSRTTCIVFS